MLNLNALVTASLSANITLPLAMAEAKIVRIANRLRSMVNKE